MNIYMKKTFNSIEDQLGEFRMKIDLEDFYLSTLLKINAYIVAGPVAQA